ncbi:MAG: hypothetical protein ACAH80_04465 [Alphaproteobacteria bacterium]
MVTEKNYPFWGRKPGFSAFCFSSTPSSSRGVPPRRIRRSRRVGQRLHVIFAEGDALHRRLRALPALVNFMHAARAEIEERLEDAGALGVGNVFSLHHRLGVDLDMRGARERFLHAAQLREILFALQRIHHALHGRRRCAVL